MRANTETTTTTTTTTTKGANAMNPDHQLAAWLIGSTYRAFHCDGCSRPIVVTLLDWRNPVYVWHATTRHGVEFVARCPYGHCAQGITRQSVPVKSY